MAVFCFMINENLFFSNKKETNKKQKERVFERQKEISIGIFLFCAPNVVIYALNAYFKVLMFTNFVKNELYYIL